MSGNHEFDKAESVMGRPLEEALSWDDQEIFIGLQRMWSRYFASPEKLRKDAYSEWVPALEDSLVGVLGFTPQAAEELVQSSFVAAQIEEGQI